MAVITVLGAGAMGSALCRPLVDSGWEVRLWGTWLDDHLLETVENGDPHPRTGAIVPKEVTLYRSYALKDALDGATVVVMSVASVGVQRVTELALDSISQAEALWLTSKGFYEDEAGRISLLPDAIRTIATRNGTPIPPIVAIAGPVKANECAEGMPTATIFGCIDGETAAKYAAATTTSHYAVASTDDEIGVEVCAPMKNVYAIALGIADGLEESTGIPHHNLKAATFTQAVAEMSRLGTALGAKPQTAFGLPGVGDLEVTGLSGRNKVFGVRIGRGEAPTDALAEMGRLEQTVEGASALPLALKLVEQTKGITLDDFPLLKAVHQIVRGDSKEKVKDIVSRAVLPRTR
ncbi:NAD(P)H-dependent glycerol-3-phosphate dehydrogenase [Schaalia vaccimaxillae]|uniref:NAD(P)H-dependent glycerol-3-phosphate dehydrogenase n=1 Tax=Schaalia vaccimaxillae TaxID=183916 RepID=UPI0003B35110|nr:NAD-dependent glycerol-3-phosphate dehydrogenase [Schaalia vaccimaxillae]